MTNQQKIIELEIKIMQTISAEIAEDCQREINILKQQTQ